MKLNIHKPTIEVSGELSEKLFSLGDPGLIFDILRSKMYSNPILAICREYSCNARDAHREVGKFDLPIEITLPNHLEPFYKIRDFGPGISPERVENIFVKYGASSKREDNIQTGAFGLGSKTGFSYTDTFTITTAVDGTKYSYTCFIDETRVGKLMLLHSEPTTDGNGTEIVIPVKPQDFYFFRDWTELSTRNWEVKPIIKGDPRFEWQRYEHILNGENWFISKRKDYYNKVIKLIIDGIEYPLDLDALRKYVNTKFIDVMCGDLHLCFGIGELTLSANREQVYLDDLTKNKIKDRLDDLFKELKNKVVEKINSFDNLWDANLYFKNDFREIFDNLNSFGTLYWKDFALSAHSAVSTDGCPVISFSKNRYGSNNKIKQHTSHCITFEAGSILYLNDLDLKEPLTARHVKSIFDNNSITLIQIICPTEQVSVENLNKKIGLEYLNAKLLSEDIDISDKKRKSAANRVLVFKFHQYVSQFRRIGYSDIEKDTNVKLLVSLSKDEYTNIRHPKYFDSSINTPLSLHLLNNLMQMCPNISIYGLDLTVPEKRIKEDFADFIKIEDFLKEQLVILNDQFIEIKFSEINSGYIDGKYLDILDEYSKLITDPNSLFLKKIKINHKLYELTQSKKSALLPLYEEINGEITVHQIIDYQNKNPDLFLEDLNQKLIEKYPLLEHINTYRISHICNELSQYINLIDKA